MNEAPMCFQQNDLYSLSQTHQDETSIGIQSNDNSNGDFAKRANSKSIFSFCNASFYKSPLSIICIISCIIGSVLLRISYVPTSNHDENNENFIGNIESNNGEKINFARMFGMIFLTPSFFLIFHFYGIILHPFHKKLAPPESTVEYECEL